MKGFRLSMASLASMLRVAYESDNPRATLFAMVEPYAMTEDLLKQVSLRDIVISMTHETFVYYATSFAHVYQHTPALLPVFYDAPNRALPYVHFAVDDHGVLQVVSSHRTPPLRVYIKRKHSVLGEMFPLEMEYFSVSAATSADVSTTTLSISVSTDAGTVDEVAVLCKSDAPDFAMLFNRRRCVCVKSSMGACVDLPILMHANDFIV